MNEHIREEIFKGVNLHTIIVDKFKTNLIKFNFQRPLIQGESTLNGLLPMVLHRGTENLQTSKMLSKELEYLYGAYLNSNVVKKGERHIVDFTLGVADLNFVEDRNLLNESLKLMNDVINKPYKENGLFKKEYLQQEKSNLEKRIKARVNDKNRYAVERCIEEMCSEENFALYEQGRLEDLPNINENNLFNYYKQFINNSPVDIMVVGNLNHADIKKVILDQFEFNSGEKIKIPREKIDFIPKQIKKVRESMDISQGKLTMGFRNNIPYEDPSYPALMVYVNLLGGGAHSKLFLKVREERSLCYYIYSKMDKFKSIMLVSCGIEVDKYDETVEVIMQQLEEIKKGNISNEEMENTKKAMINSVNEMGDNASAMADFYYGQVITKQYYSPSQLIDQIQNVKKEEIVAVAEKMMLDTIYFLNNQQM